KLPGIPWITSVTIRSATSSTQLEGWVTLSDPTGALNHIFYSPDVGNVDWQTLDGSGANRFPDTNATALQLDPKDSGTVYVGTEWGVLVCTTCGGGSVTPSWHTMGTGLPGVYVKSLTFSEDGSSLIAWTWVRGAFT